MNPQINCVIVAQPQYTTAFCITGRPFNSSGIPESHLVMGNVPSLPFESITNSGHAIAQIFAGSTSTAVSCAPVSMDEGDGVCNTTSGNNSITSVLVNGLDSLVLVLHPLRPLYKSKCVNLVVVSF